ncbi:MAG TPA: 2'-5' RNA ligase family protein [Stellaceae bacterium]|jgi:2'-5' RNA ligase|nr:2'-5' RNA ligase family protein [Stellaceae bacterium]
MAFGIGITAPGETGWRLREYWSKFSRFERAPSMVALDHPPHVTLAVYDSIPERQLSEVLRSVFGVHPPLRLRFNKLAFFEMPELVFWAAPEQSEQLLHAHSAIHELIDPWLCRSHYQPGVWVPHCTLATQVTAGNKEEAIALAAGTIEPFEVLFDKAECVEFYPIRTIDECALSMAA